MKIKSHFLSGLNSLLFLILFTAFAPVLSAQNTEDEIETLAVDSVVIRHYEPTRITEAFNTTNNILGEAGKKQMSEEAYEVYKQEVDTLFSQIDKFLYDSTVLSMERVSIREMDQIAQRADSYGRHIGRLQESLTKEAEGIEEAMASLDFNKRRWQLTLDADTNGEMLASRVERIKLVIHQGDSVNGLLRADMQMILGLQDRFYDKQNELDLVNERVKEGKSKMGERLLARDQPNIFRDLKNLGDSSLIQAHKDKFRESVKTDFELLKKEHSAPVITALVFLLLMMVLAIWYKRNLKKIVDLDNFKLSRDHLIITQAPVASMLFVVTLLIRFLVPDMPGTFMNINLFIMMVPMTILIIRLFGRRVATWMIVLIVTYTLTFLYELSYYPDVWLRLLQVVISSLALWLFMWSMLKKPFGESFTSELMPRLFRILFGFFVVLEAVALMANIAGAFQLSEFLTLLPIRITVLAIGIIMSVQMADAIVYLLLASNYFQKVNSIREGFESLYKKIVRLIEIFLWLFFFITALGIFRLKDAVFDWGGGVLNGAIKIGQVEVTLGNILILVLVIWLSIVITRIVSSVLEKDIFSRVQMSKGVPSTIILLVRIALISAGFFLAMAAAGMKLTNLSIVLGAFSVGIGFGLQNIFNNMVSGLILAFERPLKVGDIVEVGELLGVVRSIGLRSSTIRTFDGAEVIVPNGNLISNEMTNWTKSDSIRRMDIQVGVAYGTDPKIVMELMQGVANAHEKVRKSPEARVYFNQFGDSSLDFRLLAWVHIDFRLETESEIKVEINRRLADAGIEIPFPQRDLHIRDQVEATRPAAKATKK